MTITRTGPQSLAIKIDGSLFPEQVIFKCFYWYAASYTVNIFKDGLNFMVELTNNEEEISDIHFDQISRKITTDLIDFKTRQIIQSETIDIKNILIAKAFSSFDEFDQQPDGVISDPVGFKVD